MTESSLSVDAVDSNGDKLTRDSINWSIFWQVLCFGSSGIAVLHCRMAVRSFRLVISWFLFGWFMFRASSSWFCWSFDSCWFSMFTGWSVSCGRCFDWLAFDWDRCNGCVWAHRLEVDLHWERIALDQQISFGSSSFVKLKSQTVLFTNQNKKEARKLQNDNG